MQCGTHSKHFPTHQTRIKHLRHITEDMKISILPTVPIFAGIREFRFKVKEAKCDFCMKKIKDLEYIIDKDGRRPNPERATAIKDMSTPNNVTTLKSFLGLAHDYQSFIKNLHDFSAPLNELQKKKR